jgi:hypothetical protein
MTEQAPDTTGGKTPLVQSSVKADTPRPAEEDPKAAAGDPYGQAKLLRAQASAIEAAIPADAPYVRMKTEQPHVEFSFGGTVVGADWTLVHASLAPGVLRAAADAGVSVTQKEGQ